MTATRAISPGMETPVHFRETCDEDLPHLITHVLTTDATETDMEHTEAIHQALAQRTLLPATHLMDAGYVDAGLILASEQQDDIALVGPVSQNNQWQAKAAQGYDLASFHIDWQGRYATCPQGNQSVQWTQRRDQHGHPKIAIRFGLHDCRFCPTRSLCTRSARAPRILAVRYQSEHEILLQARAREKGKEFLTLYGQRSGTLWNSLSSCANDGITSNTLSWFDEDRSPAHLYCSGSQSPSFGCFSRWEKGDQDTHLALCHLSPR